MINDAHIDVVVNINVSESDGWGLHKCIIWCRDASDDILPGPSDLSMYYAANV